MSYVESCLISYLADGEERAGIRSGVGYALEAAAARRQIPKPPRRSRDLEKGEAANQEILQNVDARPRSGGGGGSHSKPDPYDKPPEWHTGVTSDRIVVAALRRLRPPDRHVLLAVYAPPSAGVVVNDKPSDEHKRTPRLPASVVHVFSYWSPLIADHPKFYLELDELAKDQKGKPFKARSALDRTVYALSALANRLEHSALRIEIVKDCLAAWRSAMREFVAYFNEEARHRAKKGFRPAEVPDVPMTRSAPRNPRSTGAKGPQLKAPSVPADMQWEVETAKEDIARRVADAKKALRPTARSSGAGR